MAQNLCQPTNLTGVSITLFNTQNVMETRLAQLYYFEAAEFENGIEIFSLALVFELQLWLEISLFSPQLNIRSPSTKVGNTLSGRRDSHTTMKSRDRSFHQDISVMEHRYKGKWSAAMLGDYCCMMKRGAPETKYHRQAKRTSS